MTEAKRSQIKRKVTAAQSRNVARAGPKTTELASEKQASLTDKITSFAKEHPVAIVAGGVAAGVLISSFFRGSPTRKAGRAIGQKTASLAAIAADMAIAFAQQAYEAADEARRASADKLGELGGAVGDSARSLTSDAADYAAGATESARKAGKSAFEALRSRLN